MSKRIRRVRRDDSKESNSRDGYEYIVELKWREEYSGGIRYNFNGTAKELMNRLEDDQPLVEDLIKNTIDNHDDEFYGMGNEINIVVKDVYGDSELSGGIYNVPDEDVSTMEEFEESNTVVDNDRLNLYKDNIKEKYYSIKGLVEESNEQEETIDKLEKKIEELNDDKNKYIEKAAKAEDTVKEVREENDTLYDELDNLLTLKEDLIPLVKRLIKLKDEVPFLDQLLSKEDEFPYEKFHDVLEDILIAYKDNDEVPDKLFEEDFNKKDLKDLKPVSKITKDYDDAKLKEYIDSNDELEMVKCSKCNTKYIKKVEDEYNCPKCNTPLE